MKFFLINNNLIFRLIIVGIIIIGLFYPVLIIFNVLFCFTLAITSVAWVPLLLILRLIFHWIIFDFDNPKN
jgi:hypothetical protein